MRQSSYSIGTKQKDIRSLAGDHYVNVNIKVNKSVVNAALVEGVLPAGTRVTNTGEKASTTTDTSNAYGVLFADVDFNNSKGTEVLPVCIHGFLSKSKIKEFSGSDVDVAEEKALNMIKFL